ncbi:MAG: hypothetical protein CML43_14670 [Rhodobacteraceae bacterium]|nr:hypothetical protein [Paracoccaceae bacterium]
MQTRPTPALHAGSLGLLPLRCLHRLMQRRVFVRYNVDPGPWLFAQVLEVHPTLEVHPLLVELITAVAVAAVEPLGTPRCGVHHPPGKDHQKDFAASRPLPLWKTDAILRAYRRSAPPSRALLALYVLTVNDVRRERMQRGGEPMHTVPRLEVPLPRPYGAAFLGQLRLAGLLGALQRIDLSGHTGDAPWVTALRAPLESLLLAEQPHLRDARSLLLQAESAAVGVTRPPSQSAKAFLAGALAEATRSMEDAGADKPLALAAAMDKAAAALAQVQHGVTAVDYDRFWRLVCFVETAAPFLALASLCPAHAPPLPPPPPSLSPTRLSRAFPPAVVQRCLSWGH